MTVTHWAPTANDSSDALWCRCVWRCRSQVEPRIRSGQQYNVGNLADLQTKRSICLRGHIQSVFKVFYLFPIFAAGNVCTQLSSLNTRTASYASLQCLAPATDQWWVCVRPRTMWRRTPSRTSIRWLGNRKRDSSTLGVETNIRWFRPDLNRSSCTRRSVIMLSFFAARSVSELVKTHSFSIGFNVCWSFFGST